MNRLPRSVIVGHRTWKIRRWTKAQAKRKRRNAYGLTEYARATIWVSTSVDPPLQANILLHELGHALWHEGELSADDNEERIVSVTANLMTQMIRDNPEVFDWIASKARS